MEMEMENEFLKLLSFIEPSYFLVQRISRPDKTLRLPLHRNLQNGTQQVHHSPTSFNFLPTEGNSQYKCSQNVTVGRSGSISERRQRESVRVC